jgi:hypothetical protein
MQADRMFATARSMRRSDEEELSDRLYMCESMVVFKPEKMLRKALWRSTRGGYFQLIEDGVGHLSCDYYAIKINRLPSHEGEPIEPIDLLRHIRLNLNDFVDPSLAKFRPYGFNEETQRRNRAQWMSELPKGALLHIDIPVPFPDSPVEDDATVMVSHATTHSWIFSTVFTPKLWQAGNGAHPVNGNREFGVATGGDDRHTIWTRAADRLNGLLETGGEWLGLVSKNQDRLWRGFQDRVVQFINDSGGSARASEPVVRTFDWDEVRSYLAERYCPSPMDIDEAMPSLCEREPTIAGKLYRIRAGDTLLSVAERAYGAGGWTRTLQLAQSINAHPYNQRFWRADLASRAFPQGRISFSPRFACSFRTQQDARTGAAPRGSCYATILIPPRPSH